MEIFEKFEKLYEKNIFENVVYKMPVVASWPQLVNHATNITH